jgi:hypothetical protein
LRRFLIALGALALVLVPTAVVQELADAAPVLAFEATFDTPSDFYNRFDYGYSGVAPIRPGDITTFHGDHNQSCQGPTTLRDVHIGTSGATAVDFHEMFWWCAPSGEPTTGHMMTGVDTLAYNHSWFAPQPYFSNVSKVCWDVNATALSRRKWLEVQFVSQADATRYPTGTPTITGGQQSQARGTGGFDLGYTHPGFREDAPNTGIFPQGGTLAGLALFDSSLQWFDHQDQWSDTSFPYPPAPLAGTDKATRYTNCIENTDHGTVKVTQNTPVHAQFAPNGVVVRELEGQIPQHPVRVVFHDSNYDPMKDDRYNADFLTWHWDNVRVWTEGGTPPTSTTTTTTTAPPTTTTTVPPTTTTTIPPTTTTTVPPTTTTTVPDPCPASFAADARAWCAEVEARLDVLEG